MKRLSSFILCFAASAFCYAATLSPVQLLNPAGSTSGQAIVSNGPSSAPTWQSVTATSLTPQGANTVVGNFTGSTASPTAFAVPSCSSSGSALLYTSGTGLSCGSSFAMTTGATFTGALTPSQTAGIVGTTTNNNANAGSVGEVIAATGTAISLTSNTPANITSISLTPGDWDVYGSIIFIAAGSTVINAGYAGISPTSATLPNDPNTATINGLSLGVGARLSQTPLTQRWSIASTQTVYLVGQSQFTTSTLTATGTIWARRVR